MQDIHIRKVGRTGRITLKRPDALNAVTADMVAALSASLPDLACDADVDMLVIDADGEKAFSAGGDIADIYAALQDGNSAVARQFWRAEYRLNHALYAFPKPVAAFMQGFTMGGGVGLGCHGSHRIVGARSKIALPECGIGLVPDVGGSLLLARAPGRLGEYLGLTSARMDAGDAIFAGFADYFIPEDVWPALITRLEQTGDWAEIDRAAQTAPPSSLADQQDRIDTHFGGETLRDILSSLRIDTSEWAKDAVAKLNGNAPLAMAAATHLIHRARTRDRMDEALKQEYRFVHRIVEMGDFAEGIRAAIIDRDRSPKWRHEAPEAPTAADVSRMLMPLGSEELTLET